MSEPTEHDPFRDLTESLTSTGKKGKKSGGFQSMNLSPAIFNAVLKLGYKVPTPIQRKCIPILMEGRDLVAMARTGSGKTAAFLIPILNALGSHSQTIGVRALILSPTRELAEQTLNFCLSLTKFTDLRSCLIVGGDSVDEQFSKLASNPDIIIATPGRLRHLLVEVENFELKSLEYLVFDEGDRLFEMGFQDEIREILSQARTTRQTAIFSATLPEMLASFVRAGLNEPAVVRLDAEQQLSDRLENEFLFIRDEEKDAVLLYLLKEFIAADKQVIVFSATRHHVEYLQTLLAGLFPTPVGVSIYGKMDQSARKKQLLKFTTKAAHVLFVTDLAARGIDIPALDVVINYDFPEKPKLFVHRVGRTARAGRDGIAYSLVSKKDIPYVVDLALFLSKRISSSGSYGPDDLRIGTVPRHLHENYGDQIIGFYQSDVDVQGLKKSMVNSLKLYYKTRKPASQASSLRAKEYNFSNVVHPLFREFIDEDEDARSAMVAELKTFRPAQTIFEIKKITTNNFNAANAINQKRMAHSGFIEKFHEDQEKKKQQSKQAKTAVADDDGIQTEDASKPKRVLNVALPPPEAPKKSFKDEAFFLPIARPNHASERGFEIDGEGGDAIEDMVLDMTPDESSSIFRTRSISTWDKRKKNFVELKGNAAKNHIRTESGALVHRKNSDIKKGKLYEDWTNKTKKEIGKVGETEGEASASNYQEINSKRKFRHHMDKDSKKSKSELKSFDEIRKARKIKEKRQKIAGEGRKRNLAKAKFKGKGGPPPKKRKF